MATQLGLLDNRITVELAHYINISSNQLVGYPLPLSTGNSTILMNLPAKVKNTGWEFSAEMRIMDRGAMKWIASVNLTIPKNKLLAYPGGIENSPYAINYIIGQPLSIRKIYNVTGINQTTGLYE
ncbi:MAG: SusC/RagA family TonB-linked outer membrane protein, partial [Pedobacter sp.]